jgi:hypothetical protein
MPLHVHTKVSRPFPLLLDEFWDSLQRPVPVGVPFSISHAFWYCSSSVMTTPFSNCPKYGYALARRAILRAILLHCLRTGGDPL